MLINNFLPAIMISLLFIQTSSLKPLFGTVRMSYSSNSFSRQIRKTLSFCSSKAAEQLESADKLTRTSIRKMRVADLRMELTKRGLNAEGNRPFLVEKLLNSTISTNIQRSHKSTSKGDIDQGNIESLTQFQNIPEYVPLLTTNFSSFQSKFLDSDFFPESTREEEDCKSTLIAPNRKYILRFDGGSRGNPGNAGAGLVIYDETMQEVWHSSKYLGPKVTNNEAEYSALIMGLEYALHLGIKNLSIEGDSELIIRQLEGRYRVKNANLRRYYSLCLAMIAKFETIELSHIRREYNFRADELANAAMDSRESKC
jgi:ribonuclease HI